MLYLCLGGVLCAITCPESRHVLPRWSVATQRECIGSLRHKISFIRCKPLQYHGLTMCEKHTRLSQFASPLPLGVIRLAAVTECAQNWRSWRGLRQLETGNGHLHDAVFGRLRQPLTSIIPALQSKSPSTSRLLPGRFRSWKNSPHRRRFTSRNWEFPGAPNRLIR